MSTEHTTVQCASCQASPIVGTRYHCIHCSDYDLCSECFVSTSGSTRCKAGHLSVKLLHPAPSVKELTRAPAYWSERAGMNGDAHENIICNICFKRNIAGTRFRCPCCVDFDLCASCEAGGLHSEHPLVVIEAPVRFSCGSNPLWNTVPYTTSITAGALAPGGSREEARREDAPITASIMKSLMKEYLRRKGLRFSTSDTGAITIPHDGYRIVFTSKADSEIFTQLATIIDDKAITMQQRVVAATFMLKTNYSLVLGSFEIDLRDGEMFFYSANSPAGLTRAEARIALEAWFFKYILTFSHFLPGLQEISRGGNLIAAERVVAHAGEEKTEVITPPPSLPDEPREVNASQPTSGPSNPTGATQESPGADSDAPERSPRPARGNITDVPRYARADLKILKANVRQGGMGQVSHARYRGGADVAVKEIIPNAARHYYESFVGEMRKHFAIPPFPHIVQMLGVTDRGKEDRSLSLITEWCAGGDLSSVIQGAFGGDEDIQLQYRAVLRYARNIAAGVDHLHRHKVLHLDLKPANVLLDGGSDGGNAKVGDFGLSTVMETSQHSPTLHGGTPGYMAPECISLSSFPGQSVGPAADIYALGMIMFQLFTGVYTILPTSRVAWAQRQSQVVQDNLRPKIPPGLSWPGEQAITDRVTSLIQHCWQGNPADRPRIDFILQEINAIEDQVRNTGGLDTVVPVPSDRDQQWWA